MTIFGKLLVNLRMIWLYENGDGFGFVWNWYNPLAWVMAFLSIIMAVLYVGIPMSWRDKHDIGFGLDPYFQVNPEELKWINDASEHSTRFRK